ncbi:MAG TPA: glycosyltransferase family 4 protein [Actinomycetota bacterium]|jgi:glycosyltransferase involved in cell wall biosynthesis
MNRRGLVVVETHPVQYHAPVYRELGRLGVAVTAIYGSDFSVAGYTDPEFQTHVAWDTDLLSGYRSVFVSRVATGGATAPLAVTGGGLRAALEEARPSAIMILGYGLRYHRRAIWDATRSGHPLLFRGETTDHARARTRAEEGLRNQLLRALYARCSRLLYIGTRSREHFLRLGCPTERLVFSPYCVDGTSFRSTEADRAALRGRIRSEWGAGEDVAVVLFSGKLVERKGCRLALDAVRELVERSQRQVLLVYLGDGPLRDELSKRAEAPLEAPDEPEAPDEEDGHPGVRVLFAGFQNQSALSAYFHGADVLVLPSRHSETWGLVVNEALSHGLPCVVSDAVGCAPDLVEAGVTGEVAESGSVESLSHALRRGLVLARRLEIRRQCRAKVATFSVGRAAAGIAEAFFEVAGSEGGARAAPGLGG